MNDILYVAIDTKHFDHVVNRDKCLTRLLSDCIDFGADSENDFYIVVKTINKHGKVETLLKCSSIESLKFCRDLSKELNF